MGGGPLGGGSGINMDGVQNSRIENNLRLRQPRQRHLALQRSTAAGGSSGNLVINNTVHQPADGRWASNISTDRPTTRCSTTSW